MSASRFLLLGTAGMLLAAVHAAASAETLEVHELEATPQSYLNRDLIVAGRFRSATAGEMSLVDSRIVFRVPVRSSTLRNADAVEAHGRLAREGDRWVFTAEKVARVPPARDEFAQRRRLIPDDNLGALLDLGRWVRRRADWYDDEELRRLADAALRDAVKQQRARLARSGDAEGLWKLALQAASEGLPAEEVDALRHHALHLELGSAMSPGQLAALRARARDLFPRSREPAGAGPLPLDAYRSDPLRAYDAQTPEGRGVLERLLLTEIIARELDARAAEAGAKLGELAAQARREVPDRPEVVARLELAAVRYDARDPSRLARGRLVQLADELRRLEQPREAEALLRGGLAAARTRLDSQDADGRVELADAYLSLLGDHAAAGELLLEAWALAPRLPELPEKLSDLGYVLQGQRWRPSADAPSQGASPAPANPLQPGTPETTVTGILGQPSRVSRVITGSGVTEQWIYDGPPRLDVYLRRATGGRTATVLGVRSP